MSLLTILRYPDPLLRVKSDAVTDIDEEINTLIDDMLSTMYQAPGIGLAAPQVNVAKRLLVIDISDERNNPLVLINPEITSCEGSRSVEEGCLSVPGIYDNVERARQIQVRAVDRNGNPLDIEVDGMLAVCVQHEVDHLDGKLFVDYLSELKRQRIQKKLEKMRRHNL